MANTSTSKLWLIIPVIILLITWIYSRVPSHDVENKAWLTLLQNKGVDKIWLRGPKSAELYDIIDTVRIDDKQIINKVSYYAKNSKLIYRRDLNFKARSPTCHAVLISGDSSYQIPLLKFNDGRGMFESSQTDSIYLNNRLMFFLDSIFQVGIRNK